MSEPIKLLVIEDNADYQLLLRVLLEQQSFAKFTITYASTFREGLEKLKDSFDAILIDLHLPDCENSLEAIDLLKRSSKAPVLLISADPDHENYKKAIEAGAQDFLGKDPKIVEEVLPKAIQFAIERNAKELETQKLAHSDELTGLNNRRGFFNSIEQKMLTIEEDQFACVIDANNLKKINDEYGHNFGDMAIVSLARVIRDISSRNKLIVGRIGGDEFYVHGVVFEDFERNLSKQLDQELVKFNRSSPYPFDITVSYGFAQGKHDDHLSTIIQRADEEMYKMKGSQESE